MQSSSPVVAVVGSGRMGAGLVRRLAPVHPGLLWSGRDPESLAHRANELVPSTPPEVVSHVEAVRRADILILALWHRDAVPFVRQYRQELAGRIVVDIANPFPDDFAGFTLPETTSAAEVLAAAAPQARVVGALKNTFWAVLEDPEFPEGRSDVLVTADDDEAKGVVMGVLASLPVRVLDAGPLRNSRTVERMTLLSREVALRYGHYPRTTWRLLGQAPERA